jgi:integrase
MIKSRNYQVIWVYCKDFPEREIPLVVLADGRPGYVINQWIFYLLDEEITPSRLEQYIRSLCHLYDFAMARYTDFNSVRDKGALLEEFIDAKKFGTDSYSLKTDDRHSWLLSLGLYWKPLLKRTKTIALYLDAINQFDEWQVTFHKSIALNPYEEQFMSAWEIYRDFQQRTHWDPFLHLHASRQHTKRDYKTAAYGKYSHKRHECRNRSTPKAFPFDKFVDLIDQTVNPRDKLLWLLMGAGSLRSSETLHLFSSDVKGVDPEHKDTIICLADPEYGYVQWTDKNGKQQSNTRESYFSSEFKNSFFPKNHPLRNLQPRTKYGRRNTQLHVGFKGMTFGDIEGAGYVLLQSDKLRSIDEHYLWWLNKVYGQVFYHFFNKYLEKYYWLNPFTGAPNPKGWPWHPWLFMCTNRQNYGMPLTMPALKGAWQRALKRINMEDSGYGLHSLRHMYGYACANILEDVPIETTQMLMHHASITSTQIYYRLDSDTIRGTLTQAAMKKQIATKWKTLLE